MRRTPEISTDLSDAAAGPPEFDLAFHLFGPVVVRIRESDAVWRLTPHGRTLGEGMAKARSALVGRSAIEIGVGSGIHAIAALKLGARTIDVTDICSQALELAAENARMNGVALRRTWQHDWLNFEAPEPYDLLLCNPPFGKAGTPDRRFFIQTLIRDGGSFVRPGGHLLFVQSSMANFFLTEEELARDGWHAEVVHEVRSIFREYYFAEPGFLEESRRVPLGFEEIDSVYVETLRVYLATKT